MNRLMCWCFLWLQIILQIEGFTCILVWGIHCFSILFINLIILQNNTWFSILIFDHWNLLWLNSSDIVVALLKKRYRMRILIMMLMNEQISWFKLFIRCYLCILLANTFDEIRISWLSCCSACSWISINKSLVL